MSLENKKIYLKKEVVYSYYNYLNIKKNINNLTKLFSLMIITI
jgi:hypothetical protein